MITDYRKKLKNGDSVAYNIIETKKKRAWEVIWEEYLNVSWLAPYESAISHKRLKHLTKNFRPFRLALRSTHESKR
jgi:hypothetical protein